MRPSKRARGLLGLLALAAGGWALAAGCSSAPRVELPMPESGGFLTLEQQRQLSRDQIETYCLMLDDHLAALRSDVELARRMSDSLTTVLDSLNDAHSEANRQARVLERELRDLKKERSKASSYTTREGDSLMKLSGLFYGTAADWRKIYEANREQIEDPGQELKPGLQLTIP